MLTRSKFIVALDSFKGSVTAPEACAAVQRGLESALPSATIISHPMADGGEGTGQLLTAHRHGQWIPVNTMGPLPEMRVASGFGWVESTRTAIVEMAASSGLPLLRAEQRNPMQTTTYGTGELIAAAIAHGAHHILLALGGSATVDAGLGAAQALGWSFKDAGGRELPPGGIGLLDLCQIIPPDHRNLPPITVLCDVITPLTGSMGCVAVFAPQKGATEHMMKDLAAGMDHVARVVEQQLGISVANITSGGAAGGLGAAAVAFMGATLTPGARCFIRETGLHALVDGTTWLITGEGCLDSQSLQGKVVSGIIETAQAAGARVAVIAGQVRLAQDQYRAAGITHALPIMQPGMSLQEALTHTPELLHTTAARLALLFAGSHTTARSCRKGLGTASAT